MPDLRFAEAFAKYGAKPKNVQWSVCADAPDGALVVSLWEHHFQPPKDGKVVCRDRFDRWKGPGNNEFREKVQRAFQTGQRVYLVLAHAERPGEVQAGADASTLRKSFSVREDWVGRVSRVEGEEYEFEFARR
jgi:hypothetical protein